jgi:hypothetical protein
MKCVVAPKVGLRWKRRQQKPSALRDSLCDGTSKPDVSGIETAVAKRRSQTASVTVRLYIWAAFSTVRGNCMTGRSDQRSLISPFFENLNVCWQSASSTLDPRTENKNRQI